MIHAYFQDRAMAAVEAPGLAPPGTYTVETIVGVYPDDTWDSVFFDGDVISP